MIRMVGGCGGKVHFIASIAGCIYKNRHIQYGQKIESFYNGNRLQLQSIFHFIFFLWNCIASALIKFPQDKDNKIETIKAKNKRKKTLSNDFDFDFDRIVVYSYHKFQSMNPVQAKSILAST